MLEIDGYNTLNVIIKELGIGQLKARQAIAALQITPTTFNVDRRARYYSAEDVRRIRAWLLQRQVQGEQGDQGNLGA